MDTLGIRKRLPLIEVYVQWRIQGRGPPPLFLKLQTAEINFEKLLG